MCLVVLLKLCSLLNLLLLVLPYSFLQLLFNLFISEVLYATDSVTTLHFLVVVLSNCSILLYRNFNFCELEDVAPIYATRICNLAADQKCDALKRRADVVGQQNDAMKRRSELLDRMANVLKRAKALEHRDNALHALRLRADALGRRADEYLWSAKTFGLRAKALLERARAFCLQVGAYKPRLKFFVKSDKEFYGFA
ncbi:hypothetical protein CTI12_AA599400 [Artemisia annua]|uniref:Uncharacterized protein n=1 Tax=Artemisia annua TaxID=35608 RepID=A0A2U1KIA4_ARTAN|nr:hypothetical protein CTI12_AA599400 [Artemisia annua]